MSAAPDWPLVEPNKVASALSMMALAVFGKGLPAASTAASPTNGCTNSRPKSRDSKRATVGRIASGAASSPSMTAMVFFITWRGVARNGVVPGERLELSQGRPYQILSLARLPISPPRRGLAPAIAGHEDCSEPGHAGQSPSRLWSWRGCAAGGALTATLRRGSGACPGPRCPRSASSPGSPSKRPSARGCGPSAPPARSRRRVHPAPRRWPDPGGRP